MSLKSVPALTIVAVLLLCTAVFAQDDSTEKSFPLQRESSSAEQELELTDEASFQRWEPAVKQGTIEFSFGIGFLGLNTTLLQHDQMIYKYTTENSYFGDVEIKGQGAFHPTARLGVNISRWFALEAVGGVSFSDYTATVENRKSQKNEPGAAVIFDPPLGEFDAEKRSLITGNIGINAVVYPLNLHGERVHLVQPYVTFGVAQMWYNMNSNFIDDLSSMVDVNGGLGIRLLADRAISVRFEVLMRHHTLQWEPAEAYTTQEAGTVEVPLEEWPIDGSRQSITAFESNTITALDWTIGVQGSF